MTHTKKLFQLHYDHREWLNKLAFYNDDLKLLQLRLEEVNAKNSDKEVKSLVEHFQNQIIIQQANLDDLRKEIEQHEKALQALIKQNAVAPDRQSIDDTTGQEEKVKDFEHIFADFRGELYEFIAKWM